MMGLLIEKINCALQPLNEYKDLGQIDPKIVYIAIWE